MIRSVCHSTARRLVAGLATGFAVAWLGAAGHLLAGGHLHPRSLGVLALVAAAAGGPTRRWARGRLGRLAVAVMLAQPLLHLVLQATAPAGHPAHSHGDGGSMLLAHLAAGSLALVALRWGARWLRALPGVARALRVPRRTPAVVVARVRWDAPAGDPWIASLAVPAAHGSRGPPRTN